MKGPLISVIIPVHNGEEFLREALDSVDSQSYEPFEVIIVDDGSTDRTPEIAESYRGAAYIFQENAGPASARNTGLRAARGEIVGFLDSDDMWPGDKITTQLARLLADPSLEVVLGRIQFIGDLDRRDMQVRFEDEDLTIVGVNLGAGLFRRSVFDRVGLFDESLVHYEDYDWFMRAREKDVSMTILKHVTLLYRRHASSMSRHKDPSENILGVLSSSIRRRRRANPEHAPEIRLFTDYDEKSSGDADRQVGE